MRTDQLKQGLTAPICLTWELTYGCKLACVHCLSSSGRRDPDELSTAVPSVQSSTWGPRVVRVPDWASSWQRVRSKSSIGTG